MMLRHTCLQHVFAAPASSEMRRAADLLSPDRLSRSRLPAAADGDRDLFRAFQFCQFIVEPCTHITDLALGVDGLL